MQSGGATSVKSGSLGVKRGGRCAVGASGGGGARLSVFAVVADVVYLERCTQSGNGDAAVETWVTSMRE